MQEHMLSWAPGERRLNSVRTWRGLTWRVVGSQGRGVRTRPGQLVECQGWEADLGVSQALPHLEPGLRQKGERWGVGAMTWQSGQIRLEH